MIKGSREGERGGVETEKRPSRRRSARISVVPPTQGTWRSNDYVNALRLVCYGY